MELGINYVKYYFIVILLIITTGCKKPTDRSCFKSNGEVISEKRNINNFNCIVITDDIELSLTQSSENYVIISTGKNIINFIKTEIKNDTLYISNENKCNILRSYQNKILVSINLKNIKYIQTRSSKNITSTNELQFDTLRVEGFFFNGDVNISAKGNYFAGIIHSGGGNIKVIGSVKKSYAYQIGNGNVDYLNLNAITSHIHSRTFSDSYVNASTKLTVEIHSSGNIYYNSNFSPEIQLKKYGNGQLFQY